MRGYSADFGSGLLDELELPGSAYPGIVDQAARVVGEVNPGSAVRVRKRIGCSVVASYWRQWPVVFPQHAPGRKHERRIMLARLRRDITEAYPRELARGLIHSDAYRFVANQRVGGKTYRHSRHVGPKS